MSNSTAPTSSSPLLDTFFGLLAAYRCAVKQEHVYVRLAQLSIGSLLSLGRHTINQMLVALGLGADDWSAWYRLFNCRRINLEHV